MKGLKTVNGRKVLAKGYKWGKAGKPIKATGAKKKASKKRKKKTASRTGGAFCPKAPKGMKVGAIRKIRGRYWKKAKGGKMIKSNAAAAKARKSAIAKKAGRKRRR